MLLPSMNVKPFDMRIVSIHTGASSYLDHIGVLSIQLGIPLIVTEQALFESAQKFYPELDVIYKDPIDLSLPFLAENFDAILSSGHYWAGELIPLLKLFCGKEMRIVYCPHGNSDKETTALKDLTFIYGEQMRARQPKHQPFVRTGNYRYPYYRARQPFYDRLLQQQLAGKIDPAEKNPPLCPHVERSK